MTSLPLICSQPVCIPACEGKRCPIEVAAAQRRFRQGVKQRRVFGPIPYWEGRWLLLVEGYNPWPETGA
jgi:hypothetical protein